jgi:hypothetical protein
MTPRYKNLTIKLSDLLELSVYDFCLENLNSTENTSDLINLVLSAHISSLFNHMKGISNGNEEITKNVNNFIEKISEAIQLSDPINKVEVIRGQ